MKKITKIISRYVVLGVIFSSLFMSSCEVVDPVGTLIFDNQDDCIYECYFDGVLLGSVSNFSTASFEVDAICALAETKNDDYGNGELQACVDEDGIYTVTVDLDEPTGTITYDNFMSCGYYCYYDDEMLGYVEGYSVKTFTVEVGCARAEVETYGTCGNGYKDDVCIVKDENYTLNINF